MRNRLLADLPLAKAYDESKHKRDESGKWSAGGAAALGAAGGAAAGGAVGYRHGRAKAGLHVADLKAKRHWLSRMPAGIFDTRPAVVLRRMALNSLRGQIPGIRRGAHITTGIHGVEGALLGAAGGAVGGVAARQIARLVSGWNNKPKPLGADNKAKPLGKAAPDAPDMRGCCDARVAHCHASAHAILKSTGKKFAGGANHPLVVSVMGQVNALVPNMPMATPMGRMERNARVADARIPLKHAVD